MSAAVAAYLRQREAAHDRSCYRPDGRPKVRYVTRKAAHQAAKEVEKRVGKSVREYPCPVHGWHVGGYGEERV